MPISEEKLFQPQVEVPCLGTMVNIQTGIISIPEDKLQDIKSECIEWLPETQATCKQLQSMLGSLLYIHKCVKPKQIFVNNMMFTLHSAPTSGYIQPSLDLLKDARWFAALL